MLSNNCWRSVRVVLRETGDYSGGMIDEPLDLGYSRLADDLHVGASDIGG